MGEKILEVEHEPGGEYVFRFRPHRLSWLPEEARGHVYVARKEMLLALRSFIDQAIERVEEGEKGEGKGKKKGRTKIEIE
jgi:hypothetical protein